MFSSKVFNLISKISKLYLKSVRSSMKMECEMVIQTVSIFFFETITRCYLHLLTKLIGLTEI